MSLLQGRVALVTGGSRGIGAAIAKKLAQDGADVALTYARSENKAKAVVALIEAAGRRGLAKQRLLRAERGVEARRVDAHRRRELSKRRAVIAFGPKNLHGAPQGGGALEAARATSFGHRRPFCIA